MKKQHVLLYAGKKPAPLRIIRILDLPGFEALETRRWLHERSNGPLTPEFEEEADRLSEKTFKLLLAQTEFPIPDEYWLLRETDPRRWPIDQAYAAHEEQYQSTHLPYDEKAAYLKSIGWDFTNDQGELLHITELFCRQAEAVKKGIAGEMPDIAAVELESWEEKMAADARKFRPNTRR